MPHASGENGTVSVATIPWRFTYLCWNIPIMPMLLEGRSPRLLLDEGETAVETIIATFYERCLNGRSDAVRIFIEEELVSPYSGARLQQDQRGILRVFADGCKIPGADDDRRAL